MNSIRSYRYAEVPSFWYRSPRGEPRSAVFATATADARLYVVTEYFIPELVKITGRDLGFHFEDLIHLKLVLGWRSRYDR